MYVWLIIIDVNIVPVHIFDEIGLFLTVSIPIKYIGSI